VRRPRCRLDGDAERRRRVLGAGVGRAGDRHLRPAGLRSAAQRHEHGMSLDLLTALTASTITMAVPLLLAAPGEVIAARAGVLNIGLEGMMLSGAFAALVVALPTGSIALGLLCAIVVGAGLGLLLGVFVAHWNANQVVAGTALNLLAAGLTGVGYRAVFGVTGAALTISGSPQMPVPGLSQLPVIGAFFNLTLIGYAAFVAVPIVAWSLARTLPGLRLRMVGEHPYAAETQGVAVHRIRIVALILCGMLAAAGGAY